MFLGDGGVRDNYNYTGKRAVYASYLLVSDNTVVEQRVYNNTTLLLSMLLSYNHHDHLSYVDLSFKNLSSFRHYLQPLFTLPVRTHLDLD